MATDKREAWRRANALMEQNRPEQALPELWSLVDRSHVVDEELVARLRLMGRAYAELQRPRAAATILLYLGQADAALRMSDAPTDQARAEIQMGRRIDAAKSYEKAGWLGHAAIQLEEAGDDRGARVLWERLADNPALSTEPYTQGLVRFNLGRACERLGDREASRKAVVQSMHLLEAAADGFETRGLRERAFDCYQVLLTLGKDGAFENLAEGYLNCIRILKEDNLKYYVLQYFEDFQELALERGELHAAATLFREAAQFTRRHNLPYERHYRERAAQTQVQAAKKMLAEGSMPEMAENAYAAAIDLFNDLGAYSAVRDVYAELAQLDLSDKRRARYSRLRNRLAEVPDEPGKSVPFPSYLRMDTAYPEIWRLDVVEWEQRGDAAETMGEVLQDPKWPDFTRRRALLCRLHQLGSGETHLSPDTLVGLAGHLGRVEIYAALSPLEALAEHQDARVRAACTKAVRSLFFKRSFVLVMKGLEDEDGAVRHEALEAVSALHFGHAFDPLQRIYRMSPNPDVRRAALTSIGKIASVEAAEMLIDVLRQGDPDERKLVAGLLSRAEQPEVDTLLRRAVAAEQPGPIATSMEKILRARGA
ncbi:MAG: HEAT repeat domain-containing protein [Deltaproteobacteria bacterium]|nr:HEAT repeat domain-containing protein [Deltaproteobacteria bacterium]